MRNDFTEGRAWREHGIAADRVVARCRPIAAGAPRLWQYAEGPIADAVARGYLAPAR